MAEWIQRANRAVGPISVAIVIRPAVRVPLTVSLAQAAMSGTGQDLDVPAGRRGPRRPGRRFRWLAAWPVVARPWAWPAGRRVPWTVLVHLYDIK